MVTLAMSRLESPPPVFATYCRTVAEFELAEGTKGGETTIRLFLKTEIDDLGPASVSSLQEGWLYLQDSPWCANISPCPSGWYR